MTRGAGALGVSAADDPVLAIRPGDRTARDAKAVAYLRKTGNDDLLEVLGLESAPRHSLNALDVECPTCHAAVRVRCHTKQGDESQQIHSGRRRIAARSRA
jgi:hypothetical protein